MIPNIHFNSKLTCIKRSPVFKGQYLMITTVHFTCSSKLTCAKQPPVFKGDFTLSPNWLHKTGSTILIFPVSRLQCSDSDRALNFKSEGHEFESQLEQLHSLWQNPRNTVVSGQGASYSHKYLYRTGKNWL